MNKHHWLWCVLLSIVLPAGCGSAPKTEDIPREPEFLTAAGVKEEPEVSAEAGIEEESEIKGSFLYQDTKTEEEKNWFFEPMVIPFGEDITDRIVQIGESIEG